jgi:hypothetical protein
MYVAITKSLVTVNPPVTVGSSPGRAPWSESGSDHGGQQDHAYNLQRSFSGNGMEISIAILSFETKI